MLCADCAGGKAGGFFDSDALVGENPRDRAVRLPVGEQRLGSVVGRDTGSFLAVEEPGEVHADMEVVVPGGGLYRTDTGDEFGPDRHRADELGEGGDHTGLRVAAADNPRLSVDDPGSQGGQHGFYFGWLERGVHSSGEEVEVMVRHFWQTEGWRSRHRIRLTGSGDFLEGRCRCRCRAPSDRAVNDVGHRRPVKKPEVDIRCGGKFGDAVQNAWVKALGIDEYERRRAVSSQPDCGELDVFALVATLARDVASIAERFEDVSCEDMDASQVGPDGDPHRVAIGMPDCSADSESVDVDVVDCHVSCVSWS